MSVTDPQIPEKVVVARQAEVLPAAPSFFLEVFCASVGGWVGGWVEGSS